MIVTLGDIPCRGAEGCRFGDCNPGVGDTPLFFSKEGWKLITQFKTFIFAQHNRVLVSGIQQGMRHSIWELWVLSHSGLWSI